MASLLLSGRLQDVAVNETVLRQPISGFSAQPIVSLDDSLAHAPLAEKEAFLATARISVCGDDVLTKDEAGAIFLYTCEWELYGLLNRMLRELDRDKVKPFVPYIKLLVTALAKLRGNDNSPATEKKILWRGVPLDLTKEYEELVRTKRGFVQWSFMSTTVNMSQLEKFMGGATQRTLFCVHSPSAVDIAPYSAYKAEKELLVPCGIAFDVRNVYSPAPGLTIVELHEVACVLSVSVEVKGKISVDLTKIKKEVEKYAKYTFGKCGDMILDGFAGVKYENGARMLLAEDNPQLRAAGLYALGRCLGELATTKLADGRVLGRNQLFIEAISCNPEYSMAYNSLGTVLKGMETVVLLDGRTLTNKQLYIEALRCDPNFSEVYFNLFVVAGTGPVTLVDGRTLTKKQLLIESLRGNPNFSSAYFHLALSLTGTETATLMDGRILTKKQLYIEALRCDPNNSMAYNNLGSLLTIAGETASLFDGRTLNRKLLYIEALRCNPNLSAAYQNLAALPFEGDTVTLADGRVLSRWQLTLMAMGAAK